MSKEIIGKYERGGSIKRVYIKGEGCVDREDIIKRIESGEQFNVKGTNVNIVSNQSVKNDKYLRTDNNQILKDNLGELDQRCDDLEYRLEIIRRIRNK